MTMTMSTTKKYGYDNTEMLDANLDDCLEDEDDDDLLLPSFFSTTTSTAAT